MSISDLSTNNGFLQFSQSYIFCILQQILRKYMYYNMSTLL